MACPVCGTEISFEHLPPAHEKVVENTKASYPWHENLGKVLVFIGKEKFPDGWRIKTVWLFTWDDAQDQHDVAAVGTLTVDGNTWIWEFSRQDDGGSGEELIVEVFGQRYTKIYNLPGYCGLSGKIP